MKTIYDFSVKTASGSVTSLSRYKGKVLLIVNTATECGFTKQFGSLQQLYAQFQDKGFEILAFPCNQFVNQEPRNNDEISSFCKINYGVTFQIFDKIMVNGAKADPLFSFLQEQTPGLLGTQLIKWNFTKFLIDKTGVPLKRYSPMTTPDKIEPDIQKLLDNLTVAK